MKLEIVKHTRDCEKEHPSTGRVRVFTLTTWDVVDVERCAMVSEHRTRREALLGKLAAEDRERERLNAAYAAACEARLEANTHANRVAVRQAWNAREASGLFRTERGSRPASRAGKRQAAERRAMEAR